MTSDHEKVTCSLRQDRGSVTNGSPCFISRSQDMSLRALHPSVSPPVVNTLPPLPLLPSGWCERRTTRGSNRVQNEELRSTGNVFKFTLSCHRLEICEHLLAVASRETCSSAQSDNDVKTLYEGTRSMSPAPSGLTPSGSPASRIRMRSSRVASAPQSSYLVTIQSDLAPEAFPQPSNHFSAARSCTSGLPILSHREVPLADWDRIHSSDIVRHPSTGLSSTAGAPLAREDAKTQGIKRITNSTPQLSRASSLPRPPDPDGTALSVDESPFPCASGKSQKKGRRSNDHRRFSRPHIRRLDYGLPGEFGERIRSRAVASFTDFAIAAVPGFGGLAPERQAVDLDDFAFAIPLDCVTSTPVATRKRNSTKEGPAGLWRGRRRGGVGR